MLCYFAGRHLPTILQNNGTIAVLVQTIVLNILALCRNEILVPADGWHEFVNAHHFCLYGYSHVELLFCRANDCESTSQG